MATSRTAVPPRRLQVAFDARMSLGRYRGMGRFARSMMQLPREPARDEAMFPESPFAFAARGQDLDGYRGVTRGIMIAGSGATGNS